MGAKLMTAKKLIALDIDGTMLDSRKRIPPEVAEAVRKAAAAGILLAFDTGRAVPEMDEMFAAFPEIRYAVFASGAGIFDRETNTAHGLRPLPRDAVRCILAVARDKDLMPQIVLTDRDVIQDTHLENLEHFNMGIYRPLYERTMTLVADIYGFVAENADQILKLNLYHADPAERIRTRQQLRGEAMPELELVYSEISSLECSAPGVNKGTGLERLCRHLDIPLSDCAAVGDAENDLPMLRAAGLGIAMGNAGPNLRTAADLTVADNDHAGCAEAIRAAMGGFA